jgi:hypothetical protein
MLKSIEQQVAKAPSNGTKDRYLNQNPTILVKNP